MGRDLFGADPFADRLIESASRAANADLKKLCIKGPPRQLEETGNLQPALTALSLGLWRRLVEAGMLPAAGAGHSLGPGDSAI